MTKANISKEESKQSNTSVDRRIQEKDNEIAEMREQIKLMN